MTYVRTAQSWLHLAVALDLYSRAVVGWAMHRMQQALVHAALEMAVARRLPKEEVLLHSDRGSHYCAYDYQTLLRRHRIVPSHSRPRNCWDNAAMESFFRSLKPERVYLTRYASYHEAKTDLFDTSAFTITVAATRRWAIPVRWSLSGAMRTVALTTYPPVPGQTTGRAATRFIRMVRGMLLEPVLMLACSPMSYLLSRLDRTPKH